MIARNSVGGLVSGGIILADAACPSGYTRVIAVDGRFLVGGATYNAAAGGAATHTHNVTGHTHPISSGTTNSNSGVAGFGGGPGVNTHPTHTHGGGSATSGSGGSATSDSQSNSPLFANMVLCKKD